MVKTKRSGPKIRRLFADIEVSPNVILAWRTGYDLSITSNQIVHERKIICIAYKWQGSNSIKVLRWDKDQDDKEMLKEFVDVANEADEIVWHYGDRCDGPWIRTRCLINDLPPVPDWKSVDTKKLASGRYNFNCNKLEYLAQVLGLGQKGHPGFDVWKAVTLHNCQDSLRKMCLYCADDVDLLEKVFDKLQPGAKPKTHVGVLNGLDKWTCPRTGSTHVKKNKTRVTAAGVVQHQMQNLDDGTYYTISAAAYRGYQEFIKQKNK